MKTLLTFKYTTSRGQDTYGYNICSLYVDGKKQFSTCGGGYDMKGTVFAQWVKANFLEKLKTLKSNRGSMDDNTGFYGLTFSRIGENGRHEYCKEYEPKANIHLDGACGFSSITAICKEIGIEVEYVTSEKNGDLSIYQATY